jgi:hypothetical protein
MNNSNINHKVKNKAEKSNIIKSLDIVYVQTLAFNIKYYVYLKISSKMPFFELE